MATWIVDNDTTTPVSGETNVAQAVAEAQNGDTIVIQGFATAGLLDIGKSLTIEGSPTFGGELATSQITVEAGANVTFAYLEISGGGGGSGSGLKGADGADSTAVGANGVDGTAFTGQPGSKGGDGGNGDAGSDAAPIVGVAGGAIVNDGALTIVDSVVIGLSFSGKSGGKGGNGGAGAPGGYGGSGGGTSTPGGNGGNGADGGAGGSGGAGAAGANGG
ncbi:hypothetical protein K9U33_14320, partial [Rhodoblastus acidophilus]|nr:hypothetical protein [Candidatus Rhodoblastus alkanivorans]